MSNDNTAVTPATFMQRVLDFIGGKEAKLSEAEAKAAQLSSVQAQLTQSQADLATLRQSVTTLTAQVETLTKENTALKTRDAEVTKQAADMEAEITRRSNLMAGEKLSKLGVRAVTEEPKSEQLTGVTTGMSWTDRCIAANKAVIK